MNDYDVDMMPDFTWKDILVMVVTVAAAVVGAVILVACGRSGTCHG